MPFLRKYLQLLPADITAALPKLTDLAACTREAFLVLPLGGASRATRAKWIHGDRLSVGLTYVDVIGYLDTHAPTSLLIAHNHPDGGLDFTNSDVTSTLILQTLMERRGYQILDHLVLSDRAFNSMRYARVIEFT